MFGAGNRTVLRFKTELFEQGILANTWNTSFDGVWFNGRGSQLRDLRVVGARNGLVFVGENGECTNNFVRAVEVWDCVTGVEMDGGDNPSYPTYWNHLFHVTIERPREKGLLMHVSGGGDTPNTNDIVRMRVYSHGQALFGDAIGFDIQAAKFGTLFRDCEMDLHPNAVDCVKFGTDTSGCQIANLRIEALGITNGIHMVSGAGGTFPGDMKFIHGYMNLGGAPVYDPAQEFNYTAIDFPSQRTGVELDSHSFRGRARFAQFIAEEFYMATENLTPSGDIVINGTAMTTRLNSTLGAFNADLEEASAYSPPAITDGNAGQVRLIIKTSNDANVITVREENNASGGPNGQNWHLVNDGDYVLVQSNGAEWVIIGTNLPKQNSRFSTVASGGTLNINGSIPIEYVVGDGGAVTAQLPAPSAFYAGRTVAIKRKGTQDITVQTVDGSYSLTLNNTVQAVTVFCDGNEWSILSTYKP